MEYLAIRIIKITHSFKQVLPTSVSDKCISSSWVKVNGITYRKGTVIAVESDGIDSSFGKVRYVIIHGTQKVLFLYLILHTLGLFQHVNAFEVSETKKWGYMRLTNIINHVPYNLHTMAGSKLYVPCN